MAHLIQFDATFKVGLTMQLIGHSDDDDDDDSTVQLGDKRTKIYAKNAHTQNA